MYIRQQTIEQESKMKTNIKKREQQAKRDLKTMSNHQKSNKLKLFTIEDENIYLEKEATQRGTLKP